jgi:hypothetical protein
MLFFESAWTMGCTFGSGQACHGVITTAAGRLMFKPENGITV